MEIQDRNQDRLLQDLKLKRRYSEPKLFIPRVNGRPSVAKGMSWCVYFYWRSKKNGALDKKFTFYKGINRLKTIAERRAAGASLVAAYKTALERGWNPDTKGVEITKQKEVTLEKALNKALEIKTYNLEKSTRDSYYFFSERFKDWLKKEGLLGLDPKKFTLEHFYKFWDWIRFDYKKEDGGKLSGTSINNHKRTLSALFTTMKNERFISNNFIKDIPNVKQKPENNKPFTMSQLNKIKHDLESNDPYLKLFINFMFYALLRPREICRLRVGDINEENWILSVKTKTEIVSHRRIIEKMKPTIKALKLQNFPNEYLVFSHLQTPSDSVSKNLKTRVSYFGNRFKRIKNKIGLGREYGLYSFRHNAILDLYNSLQSEGYSEQEIFIKLMPITKHKSINGIKNYLRNIMQTIPPDHGDIYKTDF